MKLKRKHNNQWMLMLMALPAILLQFVFHYLPMGGLVMAFQKLDFSKGIFTSPFVGIKNFKFLFATSDAWVITRNTVLYNAAFISLNLVCSVGLALLINELTNKKISKIVQTVLIMPFFLSMVVVAMVVFAFLDPNHGFVNAALEAIGREGQFWYNVKEPWPIFIVVIYLWKNVGYSSVIYTAVISGISKDYYEAAALDGASRWQQTRYVTLPHLRMIICINLIRSVGDMFRSDFGLFYSVPQDSGALYSVTNVLDTYIYRGIQNLGNIGMATAATFYQSVIGFALVLIANRTVKEIDPDCALF